MKKTLALVLAIVMALGCMSITAFAADNEATISAEITAADFGYTMVIPTSTTLTEAAHTDVLLGTTAAAVGDGIVSIKDIKHPTDKVNVYYTVDLTKGDLTDGTNTITAAYKYKQGEGEFAAIDGTTKVTVYANKTVTNSLVNVTADDTQWKAAPAGTYNATVVFNFAEEDAVQMVTVNFTTESGSSHQYAFTDGDGQPVTSIQVPKGTTYDITNRDVYYFEFSNGMKVNFDEVADCIYVNNVDINEFESRVIDTDVTFTLGITFYGD